MALKRTIRILVVDDHPVVRQGLIAMISTEPDMEIVGEADNGGEAVARYLELRPSVVVMDLLLPDMDGADAIRQICTQVVRCTYCGSDHGCR
jgi:DNA-binding NarL/FixJ family response regulator